MERWSNRSTILCYVVVPPCKPGCGFLLPWVYKLLCGGVGWKEKGWTPNKWSFHCQVSTVSFGFRKKKNASHFSQIGTFCSLCDSSWESWIISDEWPKTLIISVILLSCTMICVSLRECWNRSQESPCSTQTTLVRRSLPESHWCSFPARGWVFPVRVTSAFYIQVTRRLTCHYCTLLAFEECIV